MKCKTLTDSQTELVSCQERQEKPYPCEKTIFNENANAAKLKLGWNYDYGGSETAGKKRLPFGMIFFPKRHGIAMSRKIL